MHPLSCILLLSSSIVGRVPDLSSTRCGGGGAVGVGAGASISPTASSEHSRLAGFQKLHRPILEPSHLPDPLRNDGWEAVNHRNPRRRLPPPDHARELLQYCTFEGRSGRSRTLTPPPHPRRFRPLSRHLPGSQDIEVATRRVPTATDPRLHGPKASEATRPSA